MQARFRDDYTETRKQEVTGKDGKDLIPPEKMDQLELARYLAFLWGSAAQEKLEAASSTA